MKPLLIILSTCLLAPFNLSADESEKRVIATVNGVEITADQRPGRAGEDFSADYDSLSREQKSQLILALINRQLILDQARKEGFDQTERIREATRALADTYIVEQFMLNVAAGFDRSEEALRGHYEKQHSDLPEQFRVSQILLESEEAAGVILDRLASGGSFEALARSDSKDPVSAEKGGDMGWLTPGEMVPSFYLAVSALSEGEIHNQSIRTQFGWHVVRLLDRRDSTLPPFEEVFPQIQQSLMQDEMAAYLESLRSRAAIKIQPDSGFTTAKELPGIP